MAVVLKADSEPHRWHMSNTMLATARFYQSTKSPTMQQGDHVKLILLSEVVEI